MRNQTNINAMSISQCGAKAKTALARDGVSQTAHSPISNSRATFHNPATDDSLLPVALSYARRLFVDINSIIVNAARHFNFNIGEAK